LDDLENAVLDALNCHRAGGVAGVRVFVFQQMLDHGAAAIMDGKPSIDNGAAIAIPQGIAEGEMRQADMASVPRAPYAIAERVRAISVWAFWTRVASARASASREKAAAGT
jgi:hypothetical protein